MAHRQPDEDLDREALEIAERVVMKELFRRREEREACCTISAGGRVVWARGLGDLAEAVEACRVAFVFFRSPTCPYCDAMEPLIHEAARQLARRALFVKVDVSMSPDSAMAARVMATPTLVALINGREYDRIVGLPPVAYLERFIERALEAGGCAS